MRAHRLARAVTIAVLDCIHDGLVLAEAVVVRGRAVPVRPEPSPGHGPTNRVQRVEQAQKKMVLGRLADRAVEPVVPCLVLAPGRGKAAPLDAEAHLRNRSEEHTSELQSLTNLVCRLLL